MRVLHVIESLEFGGAEKVVVDLANRQVVDGAVAICCLKKTGELRSQLDPRIEVFCLQKPEGNDYGVPRRLAALTRENRADVVHAHGWGTFLEAAAASLFARQPTYVHTVHGAYLGYPPGLRSRLKKGLRHFLERRLGRRYRRVVAVSDVARRSVEHEVGLPARLLVTVHNGIPCPTGAAPVSAGRAPLTLITVGRLAEIKNQGLMLRALADLRRDGLAVRLRIVGDGPERDGLVAMARELSLGDAVEFLGFRADVGSLLAEADLFLLSSRYEGISIALLEAMRAGLPIVATSVGGVPETVVHEETGLLTPDDDAVAFGAAIRTLAHDPGLRRRLGEAGYARMQSHFSLETTACRYRAIYGMPATAGERLAPSWGTDRMRVVKVISAFDVFGPEKTVIEECRALIAAGSDCLLVNLWDTGDIPITGKVEAAGIPQVRLPSRWRFDWRTIGTLRDLLRAGPHTVAHAHGFKPDLYVLCAGRMARVPIVSTVHGWTSENLKVRAYERLQEQLWRFYDRVLCVSDGYGAIAARAGVPPARLRVIRNGIRAGYSVSVEGRAEARRRLSLEDGQVAVAIIGRLSVEKGHRRLLEAAARIGPRSPGARFFIIGEGVARPAIEAAVSELGLHDVVRLLGHRDDVRELYPGLDVLAITSDREGLPNVLLEAMLGGVPAVCMSVGGIPEVVRHGVDGVLVPAGDLPAFTDALGSLVGDPARRRTLGEAAQQRIRDEFLFEARMGKVMAVYEELAV